MSDIITQCPYCGSNVLIDLSTGELQELDQPTASSSRPRLEVQHATPEFFVYRDPTHHKSKPVVQPLFDPRPQTVVEAAAIEPLSPLQEQHTAEAVANDLKQRRLIP
jgi:hypothetical protein